VEIQDLQPLRPLPINRVGFRGVRQRAVIRTPWGPTELDLTIDVYVDVDVTRRGVHLSRNVEAVREALEAVRREAGSLEELMGSVAARLLERHAYARRAVARAATVLYVPVEYAGIQGVEPVDAAVEVEAGRDGQMLWRVEATVSGMTVCPSAQATISSLTGLDRELSPSHSQKTRLRGSVETRGVMVRIEWVAEELFASLSAPTFTLLKRPQEARLILEAFKRPRLIEDVVREAAYRLARRLAGTAPSDSRLLVEAHSLESIHPHDVYAMIALTLGEALQLTGEEGSGGAP